MCLNTAKLPWIEEPLIGSSCKSVTRVLDIGAIIRTKPTRYVLLAVRPTTGHRQCSLSLLTEVIMTEQITAILDLK